jgi:hypothetical protein
MEPSSTLEIRDSDLMFSTRSHAAYPEEIIVSTDLHPFGRTSGHRTDA